MGKQSCGSPWLFSWKGSRMVFLPLGSVPGQPSLPCVPHRPLVTPQATAALEREHRAELERLSSSLEAKHREVRCSGPGLPGRASSWSVSESPEAPSPLVGGTRPCACQWGGSLPPPKPPGEGAGPLAGLSLRLLCSAECHLLCAGASSGCPQPPEEDRGSSAERGGPAAGEPRSGGAEGSAEGSSGARV